MLKYGLVKCAHFQTLVKWARKTVIVALITMVSQWLFFVENQHHKLHEYKLHVCLQCGHAFLLTMWSCLLSYNVIMSSCLQCDHASCLQCDHAFFLQCDHAFCLQCDHAFLLTMWSCLLVYNVIMPSCLQRDHAFSLINLNTGCTPYISFGW